MTTVPPGWYDDGGGALRWWDGANWSEHVAPVEQPVAVPAGESAAASPAPEGAAPLVPPYVPDAGAAGFGAAGYSAAGYGPPPPGLAATPAFAPAERRPSRLWILWVALGAVVLAAVIALVVLVPVLWSGFVSASGVSEGPVPVSPQTSDEAGGAPVGSAPTEADQQAAVAIVEQHNEAWVTGDCDAFIATTTADLREFMELTDCAAFTFESRSIASATDDYVTTIREVEVLGSAISVSTSETYVSRFDENGNQSEQMLPYEDRYEYLVVLTDEGWRIDDFFLD